MVKLVNMSCDKILNEVSFAYDEMSKYRGFLYVCAESLFSSWTTGLGFYL